MLPKKSERTKFSFIPNAITSPLPNVPARFLNVALRAATSFARPMPDFLIIGAEKAGTTFLFNALMQHQQILPPAWKEIHYFSKNWHKHPLWYRAQLPSIAWKKLREMKIKKPVISGEASPHYYCHPRSAERIHSVIPDVKIIFLARDPVKRAYSNYKMQERRNRDDLTFEEAIDLEKERIWPHIERLHNEDNYYNYSLDFYGYLWKGLYASHLKNWLKYFPREQIFIGNSADMYGDSDAFLKRVQSFLDIDKEGHAASVSGNKGEYEAMNPDLRERLKEEFRGPNEEFFELIGEKFGW